MGRYKCLEETSMYYTCSHDIEFKSILKFGINFLQSQVNEVEKQMNYYKIPLPVKNYRIQNQEKKELFRDEFIFAQVFEGCQCYIDFLARIVRSLISNDSLRSIFTGFLKDELLLFDKLAQYGKSKGWIQITPLYRPS